MDVRIPGRIRPLLLGLSLATGACWQAAPAEHASDDGRDARPHAPALAGRWLWAETRRGTRVTRSGGAGDTLALEIGALGGYREYGHGPTLEGRYRLAKGRLYELQDSAYVVLLLDSSRFFPRSATLSPALAVRSLTADSLLLSGTGKDSSFYVFVRAGR